MFEERPQQFQQLLGELRFAAQSAQQGNSTESEAALSRVAGVPPEGVVQLSLSAMQQVVTGGGGQENQQQQQEEDRQIGPFLMLVAARLLHGGLARDWDSFWSGRLEQLRSVRNSLLETVIKSEALHHPSGWLRPAVNELAIAYAVLSKMMLVAVSDNSKEQQRQQQIQQQQQQLIQGNNNQNESTLTNLGSPSGVGFSSQSAVAAEAVDFVCTEWCQMVTSVASEQGVRTSFVYCTILRQCVEECGLSARSSIGRGMSLETHDSLREAIFDNVLPMFLSATCETILQVATRVFLLLQQQQQQGGGGGGGAEEQKQNLVKNALTKLLEVYWTALCWGPSVFASEFGVDRAPVVLMWPAKKFRSCMFQENDVSCFSPFSVSSSDLLATWNSNQEEGEQQQQNQNNKENRLLLTDAALVCFRIGVVFGLESELCLPALHCLNQLCSVSMSKVNPAHTFDHEPAQQQQQMQPGGEHQEPEDWQPLEAARWIFETSRALLSVVGFTVFRDLLPDPSSSSSSLSNNEQVIEFGGSFLRSISLSCVRLTNNAFTREVLVQNVCVERFPDSVIVPLREVAVNSIRYAFALSQAIRVQYGEEAELDIEQVYVEAIDSLLTAWRELVRLSCDDPTARKMLDGSPLLNCISSCAQTVFSNFVDSRVMFEEFQNNSNSNFGNNNNNNNNNSRKGRKGMIASSATAAASGGSNSSGGGGGLVASSMQSHGMEYCLSQIATVGLLGRQDLNASCSMMTQYIAPRINSYLETLSSSSSSSKNNNNNQQQQQQQQQQEVISYALNESVWYLFEIMAWLISDEDETNSSDIPQSMIALALQIEKEALDANAYNSEDPAFWAAVEDRVPVFTLMKGTLSFCESLIQLAPSSSSPVTSNISPLIVSAVLSLCRRYVNTYIDPDPSVYEGYSKVFSTAFNGGVDAATQILQFVSWSICLFHADDDCMKEACGLLDSLVSRPNLGEWLMSEPSRCSVLCAAASGDDSGELLTARLSGARRGALAGAIISACASNSMVETAMKFLEYYMRGLASPIVPENFLSVADSISSISNMYSHAKCIQQLETIVNSTQPYLDTVTTCVVDHRNQPVKQNTRLLKNLLEVFLNGIEVCSFNLSTETISWMLRSSVSLLDIVDVVLEHSISLCNSGSGGGGGGNNNNNNNNNNRNLSDETEQENLALLKQASALILSAAQWGSLNFNTIDNNNNEQDERERIVGQLCANGMLKVLRLARKTDLIEVQDLSSLVFRLVKEIAQTHTQYFLSVSTEDSAILLDATHWALHSADPNLMQHAFAIIEAITLAPSSFQQMPQLLHNFLDSCMDSVISGTAVEPAILTPLSNAVYALGCVLGVDALCNSFSNAVSSAPLLAREGEGRENRYVRIFAETMIHGTTFAMDRKRRRLFAPIVRRIVMMLRGANIFK